MIKYSKLGLILSLLSTTRRKQLSMVFLLMLVASAVEVMSLGAVIPFLHVISSPREAFSSEFAQPFLVYLKITQPSELLLYVTVLFVSVTVLATGIRVALVWSQTTLSRIIGADFCVLVYEKTLHQPYHIHTKRHSSEVISGAQKAANLVSYLIQPVLTMCSSLLILVAILATLYSVQPTATIVIAISFAIIYGVILKLVRLKITLSSHKIAENQTKITKIIQEGIGNIRDIIIDGTQSVYVKALRGSVVRYQKSVATNQVVGSVPRYGIEALAMLGLSVYAYFLSKSGQNLSDSLPLIGAFVLGAQRVFPLAQQMYASYITIQGAKSSTLDALDLLRQPMQMVASTNKAVKFTENITCENIHFRYSDQEPLVLKGINIKIPKNSRVGIVAKSGGGKSTLLDVIMGLLAPTGGKVLIDNVELSGANLRSWQAQISHVPQTIFLSDSTVIENIALGIPREKIDITQVQLAARKAQIEELIEDWPEKYETVVGERGIRLSGGQRQRIGIARALYKKSEVIILDEATSALDSETESQVMNSLERLGHNATILVAAHRISTLSNCDLIITINNGQVDFSGSYADYCARFTV